MFLWNRSLSAEVARALGHQLVFQGSDERVASWEILFADGRSVAVPDYEGDWSETGPLIEQFKLHVHWDDENSVWAAGRGDTFEGGRTPLQAVCFAIVALHDAGKLRA